MNNKILQNHLKDYGEKDKVEALINLKKEITKILIEILKESEDKIIQKEALLALVDNFKDNEITPVLKELIDNPKYKDRNAIFLYALGEYSNCKEEIPYLVELFVKYDYHIAWNSYNIIADMIPKFEKGVLEKSMEILEKNKNKIDDTKKELFEELIGFFKFQFDNLSEN